MDAILEHAEHQAGLGGLMDVDVHADADKQTKLDSDDTDYLISTPPGAAHDTRPPVLALTIATLSHVLQLPLRLLIFVNAIRK